MAENDPVDDILKSFRDYAYNTSPHQEYRSKPEDWFQVGKKAIVGRKATGIGWGDSYESDYDKGLAMEGIIQRLYTQKSNLTGRDVLVAVLNNIKTKKVNYPPEEEWTFAVENLEEPK